MCIRMQPCDALLPIEPSSGVPWMRIPLAFRFSARVPSGLFGPGGMNGGMFADHGACGLYHVGFNRFAVTWNCPCGVGYPPVPVATPYVLRSSPFPYSFRMLADVLDDDRRVERLGPKHGLLHVDRQLDFRRTVHHRVEHPLLGRLRVDLASELMRDDAQLDLAFDDLESCVHADPG